MTELNINKYIGKQDGDALSAGDWNALMSSIEDKVNECVEQLNYTAPTKAERFVKDHNINTIEAYEQAKEAIISIVNRGNPTEEEIQEYDFTGDGIVSISDLQALINAYNSNPSREQYWGDTTEDDIIETASALNNEHTKTHVTSKGNLEIETSNDSHIIKETVEAGKQGIVVEGNVPELTQANADVNKWYADGSSYSRVIASESPNINIETDSAIKLSAMNACVWDDVNITADNFAQYASEMGEGLKKDTEPAAEYVNGKIYGITNDDRKKSAISMATFDSNLRYVRCRQISESGGISIESDAKIKIAAPKLTLEGVTGFGSTMTFGETDEGIKMQYKATKKGKNKQCDVMQVEVYNNSDNTITFNKTSHKASNSDLLGAAEANSDVPTFCEMGDVSIPAKSSKIVAQASLYDIIRVVDYFKNNQQGPWQTT